MPTKVFNRVGGEDGLLRKLGGAGRLVNAIDSYFNGSSSIDAASFLFFSGISSQAPDKEEGMVIITTIRRLLGHNIASSDTNNNPEATIEISAALQDAIQKAIVRRRCLDAIVARQRGIASAPTTHPIASISPSDSAPPSTNTDSSATRNDLGTLGMTSSSGSPILRSPPNQSHGSPPPNVPVLTSLRDLRASEKNLLRLFDRDPDSCTTDSIIASEFDSIVAEIANYCYQESEKPGASGFFRSKFPGSTPTGAFYKDNKMSLNVIGGIVRLLEDKQGIRRKGMDTCVSENMRAAVERFRQHQVSDDRDRAASRNTTATTGVLIQGDLKRAQWSFVLQHLFEHGWKQVVGKFGLPCYLKPGGKVGKKEDYYTEDGLKAFAKELGWIRESDCDATTRGARASQARQKGQREQYDALFKKKKKSEQNSSRKKRPSPPTDDVARLDRKKRQVKGGQATVHAEMSCSRDQTDLKKEVAKLKRANKRLESKCAELTSQNTELTGAVDQIRLLVPSEKELSSDSSVPRWAVNNTFESIRNVLSRE